MRHRVFNSLESNSVWGPLLAALALIVWAGERFAGHHDGWGWGIIGAAAICIAVGFVAFCEGLGQTKTVVPPDVSTPLPAPRLELPSWWDPQADFEKNPTQWNISPSIATTAQDIADAAIQHVAVMKHQQCLERMAQLYSDGKELMHLKKDYDSPPPKEQLGGLLMSDVVHDQFSNWDSKVQQFLRDEYDSAEAALYAGKGYPRQGSETIFDTLASRLSHLESLLRQKSREAHRESR